MKCACEGVESGRCEKRASMSQKLKQVYSRSLCNLACSCVLFVADKQAQLRATCHPNLCCTMFKLWFVGKEARYDDDDEWLVPFIIVSSGQNRTTNAVQFNTRIQVQSGGYSIDRVILSYVCVCLALVIRTARARGHLNRRLCALVKFTSACCMV